MRVLVTGGAGFIGSHLVDALLKAKHTVTVLDNLDPQVHGKAQRKPSYLNKTAKFVRGDVRDAKVMARVLKNQDVLFHLAAKVGVGQSMYDINEYTSVNTMGAANVLQVIVDKKIKLKKMIVASSMSIYGEGLYQCMKHGKVHPELRSDEQMKKLDWEMTCPKCKRKVKQLPTPEDKPVIPSSIYAINKRDHEEMFLVAGRNYGIPTAAARFFNVYGPRQALSNPYTGVVALFSSAMQNNKKPLVFEDGHQSRDFVHVTDIVQGLMILMKNKKAEDAVFNMGTGRNISLNHVIKVLRKELGYKGKIDITNKFRAGDIRHCYGNISAIKKLGFKPKVRFEEGMRELCAWVKKQKSESRLDKAREELKSRGLTN